MRGALAVVIAVGCGGSSSKAIDAPIDDARPTADAKPGTFTLTTIVDGAPTNLAFVAGHDGAGVWQALTGTTGVYTLSAMTGRYGVTWVCPSSTAVHVIEATPDELPAYTADCGSPQATVSGTVSNIPASHTATVDISSGGYGAELGASNGAASLVYGGGAEPGHNDLVVTLKANGSIDTTGTLLARDLVVPAGGLSHDFDASTAFSGFESHTLTIQGASVSESVRGRAGFVTARGTYVILDYSPTTSYRAMPLAQLQAMELDFAAAVASDSSAGTARSVHSFFRTPSNATVMLPPAATASVTAASTTPLVQLRADLAAPDAQAYALVYSQAGSSWTCMVTARWLSAAGLSSYTTPDLSLTPGWSSSYALTAGTAVGYLVDVLRSTAELGGLLLPATDGTTTSLFEVSGNLTP